MDLLNRLPEYSALHPDNLQNTPPSEPDNKVREMRGQLLHQALSLLTPLEREVITSFYYFSHDDHDYAKYIGHQTGLKPGHVRALHKRALEKMRKMPFLRKLLAGEGAA